MATESAWDPGFPIKLDRGAARPWIFAAAINSTAALLNLAFTPEVVWAPFVIAAATVWAVRRMVRP